MSKRKTGASPEAIKRWGVREVSGPLKPMTEKEVKRLRDSDPIDRPFEHYERARRPINLTLDPGTVQLARVIGNGNISRGIDIAVAFHDEHVGRAPRNSRPPRRIFRQDAPRPHTRTKQEKSRGK